MTAFLEAVTTRTPEAITDAYRLCDPTDRGELSANAHFLSWLGRVLPSEIVMRTCVTVMVHGRSFVFFERTRVSSCALHRRRGRGRDAASRCATALRALTFEVRLAYIGLCRDDCDARVAAAAASRCATRCARSCAATASREGLLAGVAGLAGGHRALRRQRRERHLVRDARARRPAGVGSHRLLRPGAADAARARRGRPDRGDPVRGAARSPSASRRSSGSSREPADRAVRPRDPGRRARTPSSRARSRAARGRRASRLPGSGCWTLDLEWAGQIGHVSVAYRSTDPG